MARARSWSMILLGALLFAQGVGKALDPGAYLQALAHFRAIPTPALELVGLSWMCVELLTGSALAISGAHLAWRKRVGTPAAIGALSISLAYLALIVSGLARGLAVDNCTCFGVFLAQRLSWFVLLQELYMVAWSGFVLRGLMRRTPRARRAATREAPLPAVRPAATPP